MPNQITMPAGNTQTNIAKLPTTSQAINDLQKVTTNTPTQAEKPLYVPSYWERKDGYFKDGLFYKPTYAIFQNGEPLEPLGIHFGYEYGKANHILMHLQAVSTDSFTIEPIMWRALTDFYVEEWAA